MDNESTVDEEVPMKKKKPAMDGEEETPVVKRQNGNEDYADKRITDYSTGWSGNDKNSFMTTCVNGVKGSMGESGAQNYCSYMMEKIELIYPN